MQEMTATIKALIFDFGGVLVRTESWEPRERLARRLGLSAQELYNLVFEGEGSRLEQLGRISSEERWRQLGNTLGLGADEDLAAFRQEFFAGDVLDVELAQYVRRMRTHLRTALLSNAPSGLAGYLRTPLAIDDCFDVVVISGAVGMMKPDPGIYRLTLERLQVSPHEAVFVDDIPENVRAAGQQGIHAIQFTGRESLLGRLRGLLGEECEGSTDVRGVVGGDAVTDVPLARG